MRLLADENIEALAVAKLRAVGNDVIWAKESSPSLADPSLLQQATQEQRTLITHDKDYGDLIVRDGTPAPFGVILFRIHEDIAPEEKSDLISGTVATWLQWPPGIWTFRIGHRGP